MSPCIIIFTSSTATFGYRYKDMAAILTYTLKTLLRDFVPVCLYVFLSGAIITIHSSHHAHWAVSTQACHELNMLFVCVLSVHMHSVCSVVPCAKLKVMAVDLVGVHPSTSLSRLGPGSDWTLTQDSKSLLSLCLSFLLHTLSLALWQKADTRV